ncbi:MAG: hypothetical protein ACREB5_04035 [Sphingomonadaceae bacterium]
MDTRSALISVLIAVGFTLAACATPSSGRYYSRDEARLAWDVKYGRVLAIDDAVIEGSRSAVGRIGGGYVGYEVGRSIGSGSGSRIAGAAGAVAGAVAGQAVEERATRQAAWQFTVELDGGREIAVVQARDVAFTVGERVKVYTRRGGAARVAKLAAT